MEVFKWEDVVLGNLRLRIVSPGTLVVERDLPGSVLPASRDARAAMGRLTMWLIEQNARLKTENVKEALAGYDQLAREFIAKVDSGEARSTRTYNEMKRLLARRPHEG